MKVNIGTRLRNIFKFHRNLCFYRNFEANQRLSDLQKYFFINLIFVLYLKFV
ncbi:hypothetical protein [Alphabaculovirus altersperidaniae]|uniref:Uncharacterized protein n=1 Tax=Spodoptera eridania nucleopolyhedrovirus TaxID=2315721 RepID=A0ABX6TQ72_9ABAC|nr:hypothetical protein QKS47_gp045 [Spodoptera eridania nucleopolyhedrovirus]QNV47866.1 hypothetical protein [Spodoptera eridania nucleopolyhedrovirus]